MVDQKTIELIKEKSLEMRRDVIEMGYAAKGRGAHFGPALSSIEIVASLFFSIMHHDPKNPEMKSRDRFIQSKGHACLSYYSALVESGYFDKELMYTFKGDNTFLSGHPSRNIKRGIEVSSGSLGNGFAIACGMAKGAILQGGNQKFYVLLGDGECNEGIIWEAAMNAVKNELTNVVAIVDRNGVQLAGKTADIMDIHIEEVWRSFGWNVFTIEEGNNPEKILEAFEEINHSTSKKPYVIIAKTIKGKGISFMENSLNWHARPMDKEFYDIAISDLDKAQKGEKS